MQPQLVVRLAYLAVTSFQRHVTGEIFKIVPNQLRMSPVADADLVGALNSMGVTKLSAACEVDPGFAEQEPFAKLAQELDKLVVASSDKAR